MKHNNDTNKNTVARGAARLAMGLGTALLIAAAPQIASAETNATSVDLQSVSIVPASVSSEVQQQGVVRLVFADTSNVAAREVIFQVISRSGAVLQQIDDRGNFEPGASISHTFQVQNLEDDDVVQVAAVAYADGSTWRAGDTHVEDASEQSVLDTGRAVLPSAAMGNSDLAHGLDAN